MEQHNQITNPKQTQESTRYVLDNFGLRWLVERFKVFVRKVEAAVKDYTKFKIAESEKNTEKKLDYINKRIDNIIPIPNQEIDENIKETEIKWYKINTEE